MSQHHRQHHFRGSIVLMLVALVIAVPGVVAADGVATLGSPPPEDASAAATPPADPVDALLDFAECMRANGVDMADPTSDGMFFVAEAPGEETGFDESDFAVAEEACREHLDAVHAPERDPAQDIELMERLLAFAACMRDNGIDMPDPVLDGGDVRIGPALDARADVIDPRSDAFRAAEDACRDLSPFGGVGAWNGAP